MNSKNIISAFNQKYCRAFAKFCYSMPSCSQCELKKLKTYTWDSDCYTQWVNEVSSYAFKDIRKNVIIDSSSKK